MYHRYFESELLELNKEIQYHPDLLTILAVQGDKDIYVMIAEISAFCGMILEGDYSKDDVLKICEKCTEILRGRRIGHVNIILPPGSSVH